VHRAKLRRVSTARLCLISEWLRSHCLLSVKWSSSLWRSLGKQRRARDKWCSVRCQLANDTIYNADAYIYPAGCSVALFVIRKVCLAMVALSSVICYCSASHLSEIANDKVATRSLNIALHAMSGASRWINVGVCSVDGALYS
jgi:hypothetical protein